VPPAVYRVTHQRLALSGVRLGLAVVGLLGSVAAGAETAAALVGVAVGAGISALALVTDRRWLLLGAPSAEQLPDGARPASLARAVASGLLPSTVGVTVLAAAALAFQPILTAVLAGILAGMGIVSLVSAIEVVLWERREGSHLFADIDLHTRRYVAAAPPARIATTDA
jgi:tellurite resistance protein TehA-like permease